MHSLSCTGTHSCFTFTMFIHAINPSIAIVLCLVVSHYLYLSTCMHVRVLDDIVT